MLRRIQSLPRGQRLLIYVLIFGGGVALMCAITFYIILLTINASPRVMAQALEAGITVREFAQLPGDDAYPASVTVDAVGTIYTASYMTGAVWLITPAGEISELPGTRDQFGAVAALAAGADGSLYVLDRLDADYRAAGGTIWRIAPGGEIAEFGTIDDATGFISADDIAVDAEGFVYVSDRGRRQVWRFDTAGSGAPWWTIDLDAGGTLENESYDPLGLAYDPSTASILIAVSELNRVYRVSLDGETSEVIYQLPEGEDSLILYGITAAPDGTVYAASYRSGSANGIVRIDGPTQATYIANNFRGSSDVAYGNGRLYVTNFDSTGLVLPGVDPKLPFALDVIELGSIP
jgi:sugar lactone lactonase YvrE